jgi:hypothetical protein
MTPQYSPFLFRTTNYKIAPRLIAEREQQQAGISLPAKPGAEDP